jgi:hypothetical protein
LFYKYECMKYTNTLTLVVAVVAMLFISGCGTVDAAYTSTKGIGQSAIGGVGNIVGNGAADASKTLGVASTAVGTVVSGAGKVVGGGLDLAGGLIKGTSDIIAPPAK